VGRKDSGGTITTLSMLRAYCVHMQLASAPFTALRFGSRFFRYATPPTVP